MPTGGIGRGRRTSRTSFWGQKVGPLSAGTRPSEGGNREIRPCLKPLGKCPGSGGWIRTSECRSQSPVPYCLATPPCCRVAPASMENTNTDRGCPSFWAVNSKRRDLSFQVVSYCILVLCLMRSNTAKRVGLLLHGDHLLFCELTDTRYSPSRHHSGTV